MWPCSVARAVRPCSAAVQCGLSLSTPPAGPAWGSHLPVYPPQSLRFLLLISPLFWQHVFLARRNLRGQDFLSGALVRSLLVDLGLPASAKNPRPPSLGSVCLHLQHQFPPLSRPYLLAQGARCSPLSPLYTGRKQGAGRAHVADSAQRCWLDRRMPEKICLGYWSSFKCLCQWENKSDIGYSKFPWSTLFYF